MATGNNTWFLNCMYTIIHMIINEIMHPTVHWNGFEIVSWLFSSRTSCQTDIQGMMNSSRWSFPSFPVLASQQVSEHRENRRCVCACTYAVTVWLKQTDNEDIVAQTCECPFIKYCIVVAVKSGLIYLSALAVAGSPCLKKGWNRHTKSWSEIYMFTHQWEFLKPYRKVLLSVA